jgi:hypothetical protein
MFLAHRELSKSESKVLKHSNIQSKIMPNSSSQAYTHPDGHIFDIFSRKIQNFSGILQKNLNQVNRSMSQLAKHAPCEISAF